MPTNTGGNKLRLSEALLRQWIENAWNGISQESTVKVTSGMSKQYKCSRGWCPVEGKSCRKLSSGDEGVGRDYHIYLKARRALCLNLASKYVRSSCICIWCTESDHAKPVHSELDHAEPNQGLNRQILMWDTHSSGTLHSIEW